MWHVEQEGEHWFVVLGDHVHPIPFDSEREADRAAARLNARDELF